MYSEIHLDAPNLGELEKKYLNEAIESGYISSVGPAVSEFERKCADYVRMPGCISTSSGTAAIHIALYELGITSGDEVIVPALTFVGTVNPILYLGAHPVFVDVNSETWNMEPESIEKAVTEKTKAIIPVHLYGNPCNMDEINRIAKKYSLYVIEDAAESMGATYRGECTGTLGDLGCLSFNGNKTITTGGGGLVIGRDKRRLEHIRTLINQARSEDREMYHSEMGFNYRMTSLQAALGLAQFERLAHFLSLKKELNSVYREELKELKNIRFQKEYEMSVSSHWFTCILVDDPAMRRNMQIRLKEQGIPTRRVFTPVTEFPHFQGSRFIDFGSSHYIYERGICLPSSTRNDKKGIRNVCNAIKDFCREGILAC
jgi:perosamine synthetase